MAYHKFCREKQKIARQRMIDSFLLICFLVLFLTFLIELEVNLYLIYGSIYYQLTEYQHGWSLHNFNCSQIVKGARHVNLINMEIKLI